MLTDILQQLFGFLHDFLSVLSNLRHFVNRFDIDMFSSERYNRIIAYRR